MMSSKTTDALDNICSVCSEDTSIYALGACDHAVCFKCSTRMRVLCQQMYCAICRAELPKVIFTLKPHKFGSLETHHYPVNRKHKIYFENEDIQTLFYKLLEHRCNACPQKTFAQFGQYRDHMRKEHQLFACDLCVNHIKQFSQERRFYDRKKLAEHRRVGDKEDRSHKGHPNCQFCDVRYFDKDELVRHLRKDHFFCHFCEADGIANVYYPDHTATAQHFKEMHFLCEEGDCSSERFFTNAFRTEIDAKAHRATVHGRMLNKAAAKATRTLEVEVNLPPRQHNNRGRGYRRDNNDESHQGVARMDRRKQREEEEIQRAVTMSLNQEMSKQGHVSVLNPSLLSAENLMSRDAMSSAATTTTASASTYTSASRDFPKVRAAEKEKQEEAEKLVEEAKLKEAQEKEAVLKSNTLAKQVARANNLSVQDDGSLEETDFPLLGGRPKPVMQQQQPQHQKQRPKGKAAQNGGRWQVPSTEDFPTLRSSSAKNSPKQSPQPVHKWSQPVPQPAKAAAPAGPVLNWTVQSSANADPVPQRSAHVGRQRANFSSQDFPSLGSIGGMLVRDKQQQPQQQQQQHHHQLKQQQQMSSSKASTATTKDSQQQPKAGKTKNKSEKKSPVQSDSIGFDSADNESSAQFLFGESKKFSDVSASKGKIVGAIPAKKKEKPPAPKPIPTFRLDEEPKPKSKPAKQKSAKSKSQEVVEESKPKSKPSDEKPAKQKSAKSKAQEVVEESKPKSKPAEEKPTAKSKPQEVVAKSESNVVKNAPVVAVKDDDFPALGGGGVTKKQAVGNTWMSTEVIDVVKESNEWKEVPVTKPQKVVKPKKTKKSSPVLDDNDFPSLSKISSSLSSATWGPRAETEKNKENKSQESENSNDGFIKFEVKGKKKKGKDTSKKSPRVEEEEEAKKPNGIMGRNPEAEALIKQIVEMENEKSNGQNGIDPKEDFPLLSKENQPKKTGPPPGFKAPVKAPPPGFGGGAKIPPPGFTPPGFTPAVVHSNQGEMFGSYIKPSDFTVRNQALIGRIQDMMGDGTDKFTAFKVLSGEFRKGSVSPAMYYAQCCSILGTREFREVFPELLVLLPNISKQQQLLTVYQKDKKTEDKAVHLITCSACLQVVAGRDMLEHEYEHGGDFPALGDFPTLGTAAKT